MIPRKRHRRRCKNILHQGVWKFNFVKKRAGGYWNIHPCTFQMSRKPPPFSHFSISHQTYTTNFTLNYHNSITQKISHPMMINYPRNPYDENDSRSWRWWSTIHENDSRSWRRWYQRNRRRFLRKKESLFEDFGSYVLYLIVGVL